MTVTKTWSRDMGRLGIDPDQAGLVAGYDMVPNGVTLEDKSGNGNHGTINGPAFEFTEIGPSMKFDGVADVIDCGAGFQALTDLTVSFWLRPEEVASSSWVFAYYESLADNWGVRLTAEAPGFVGIELYDDIDNGSASLYDTVVPSGMLIHVVVQMDSLENKMYLDGELVGSGSMSTGDWSSFTGIFYQGALRTGVTPLAMPGNISNLKVLNRVWTAAEIQAEYQAGAQAINWKSDYGVTESVAAESAPGELSNSPARIISGTHKIATDTINGCSAKVVECVTAGVVAIPTEYFHGDDTQAAHGSVEFWMKKSIAGNTRAQFLFISNQDTSPSDASFDGYSLRLDPDESIRLARYDNGAATFLQVTVASVVIIDTWYKFKVQRKADGSFYTYINDTLVDLTGGVGTNPVNDNTYTQSKYIVMDLGAGDKVAWASKNGDCAITEYQGVV